MAAFEERSREDRHQFRVVVSPEDAEYAVKMILDTMAQALQEGERIEIRGFGSGDLNFRPPRLGRNPKAGEKVHVPGKNAPHFKAGKELRERVAARAIGANARADRVID